MSKFKKVAAAAIAAAMLLSLTGCNDMFKKTENSNASSASSQTSASSENNGANKFGDNIAVKSEHYTMSLPMFKRIFTNSYTNFIQYYASYYSYDTSKSSKEQYYDEENKVTWYDTFIESAESEIKQLLVLCEAALKEGMELDDTDKKSIDENMEAMKSAAAEAEQSFEEYLAKNFGEGLTEEDVRTYIEETALAQKYYNKLYNSFQYTDKQYEDTYSENKETYQYVDFLRFTFGYGTVESSDSSVTVDEQQKTKAKAYADDLAKCKTQEEFKEYITQYLNENHDYVNISTESSDGSEPTEEDYQKAIEEQVASSLNEKYAYEATSDAGKWLFDSGRKENDTYIFEGTSSYTVVMMVKTPYRDESVNKNVRHILFTADTYGSDANAKKKADEVYKEWQEGDATEESFSKLATQYNADSDPSSSASGGLYENVYRGQMVTEFNDWLFDANRQPGDTGIVKTTYGYHIMYYVGDSMASWKSSVDTVMRRNDYTTKYEELEKSITVEFDDDYIKTIPDPTEETDTEESEELPEESAAPESNSEES